MNNVGHSPLSIRIVKSISRLTTCTTRASTNLDFSFFQGCCDSFHEEISDLKESIASINVELQLIKRRLMKLKRIQPANEMEVSNSDNLENECRKSAGNSTSLFNTVNILLRRLFTVEKILAHSVSGKASNSKTVAKPKFAGEKLELPKTTYH